MSTVVLGNTSVVETYKEDPSVNVIKTRPRPELGQQTTTMRLNETEGRYASGQLTPQDKKDEWVERPSRAMNLSLLLRLWPGESDKPPAWVESDDELLAALVADHFGCPIGRPKNWTHGPVEQE